MSKISCPQCNKDDLVQKVTAIVQGETHTTEGYSTSVDSARVSGQNRVYSSKGDYQGRGDVSANISSSRVTNINAIQKSTLAEKLAPPKEPRKPNFQVTVFQNVPEWVGWVVGVILFGIIGVFLQEITDNMSTAGIISCVLTPILMFLGVILLDSNASNRRYPPEKRKTLLDMYQADLKRWEEATLRWNSLFYCRRCDLVYVPGESRGVEPAKMHEIL